MVLTAQAPGNAQTLPETVHLDKWTFKLVNTHVKMEERIVYACYRTSYPHQRFEGLPIRYFR